VNWLGDSIFTMPALQALKQGDPNVHVTMLVKPWLAALWEMHDAVDAIVKLAPGWSGVRRAAATLSRGKLAAAYVFPNSFRSALVPFLARIPERIGAAGHCRRWLLTRVVEPGGPGAEHQYHEYLGILGSPETAPPELPLLRVPLQVLDDCRDRLGSHFRRPLAPSSPFPLIGLVPGAARGPSKRWPAEHFAAVGRRLTERGRCGVAVFGSSREEDLCAGISQAIGPGCMNLTGKTSLPELAAILSLCRVVIANDSGGMHLAAAVGTKTVAIFGLTDPRKTGPLGSGHRILAAEGLPKSRDIRRTSPLAESALRSISPDRVYQETMELLAPMPPPP
jgi:heptosyltransferase-2